MRRKTSTFVIEDRELTVSNLGKVLYPAIGFTKGDLIRYYVAIAPALLPHLKDRALTMKRYPNGVRGFFFYEKNCPAHRPAWVKTADVYSQRRSGKMPYCLANNLPSLVWIANLADIELHVARARAQRQERPTHMVFDLDPGEGATIFDCVRVGIWLREKLASLRLECFPKGSGSKGFQIYVPLNTATTFEHTKAASRVIAESVEKDHPDAVVTNMRRDLRKRKMLIDWSQNDEHKTTISVYSLRAREQPQVSTPFSWKEVETLLRREQREKFFPGPDEVVARVQKHGDLFAPVLEMKQRLGRL